MVAGLENDQLEQIRTQPIWEHTLLLSKFHEKNVNAF